MGKRNRSHGRPHGSGARQEDASPALAPTPDSTFSRLTPFLAFVGLLSLYVATLAPSVLGGDSGELTAAALTGGVPHPPGYPLFAMLARLFSLLPVGHSPAWRVNLLSAVSTAAAAALLSSLVRTWTKNAAAGLLAAALFGTNSNVWLHAVSAEVFGLNAMFVALVFRLWFRVERDPRRRPVFALALACGLAMSNHHTFLFVGVPLCLRSFWIARRALRLAGFALAIAFGFAGLLPYAYLVFASQSSAAVSWGDLGTFDGFLGHILRRNYGTFSMGKASKGGAFVFEGTFFPTLWHMLGRAFPRFLWIGPLLAVLGVVRGAPERSDRRLVGVVTLVLGFYVVSYCMLSNLSTSAGLYVTVLERFFIQSDVMIAILSGLGAAALWRWLRRRWASLESRSFVGYVFAALFFLGGAAAHAGHANQRDNRVFSDFVTTALASVPRNAIVITMGDHLTGTVFYYHEVEKLRPDILHVDRELLGASWYCARLRKRYPDLFLPSGGYGKRGWNIKQLLDGNPNRPLVVIDRLDSWDQSWKEDYRLVSNGLVHPIVPVSRFPDFETWRQRDKKALGNYDIMPALRASEGSWENILAQMILTTQAGRGHLSLLYSTDNGNLPEPALVSVRLLEDIVAKVGGDKDLGIVSAPGVRTLPVGAVVWKDLGIGYEVLSQTDRSYAPKVEIAFEKFVKQAMPDDVDLPRAREYVRARQAARKQMQ